MAATGLRSSKDALAAHFFTNWKHAGTEIQPPELDLAIGTLLSARSHIKETAFLAGFGWFVKKIRELRANTAIQGCVSLPSGTSKNIKTFFVGTMTTSGT